MAITVFPKTASTRPHVQIISDTDAITGNASASEKGLLLIGSANEGKPNVPFAIQNYAQAKSIFVGGDLLDAIEVAFNPSDSGISAGPIVALRVGTATQASYVNGGLTVTSLGYSKANNEIQVALRPNKLTNDFDFQVAYQPNKYNHYYTGLGNIFSISYKGAQQYASVEVQTDSSGTGEATKLILKTGAAKESATVASSFVLGLGVYSQTAKLVDDINAIDGFSATYNNTGNKTQVLTSMYDVLPETPLKEKSVNIQSLGGDIVNAIKLGADSAVSVSYNPKGGKPAAFELTQLSGGSDGTVPQTWSGYLSSLLNQDGFYVVPLTDNSAIHAETVAFAENRSQEDNPTRVIIGGGINDTMEQTLARASALRSKRTVLIGCSGTRLMNDGTVKHLPGYMVAAMAGGIASGIPIGNSISKASLDLLDVDQKYTSSQLDMLDSQGAIGIVYTRSRGNLSFRFTDDINTYGNIDDPIAGLMSAGEAADFLTMSVKSMLDATFLNVPITVGIASLIKAAIIELLTSSKSVGMVEDFDESGISVSVTGNVANISFSVVPSLVLRNIIVNMNYTTETIAA